MGISRAKAGYGGERQTDGSTAGSGASDCVEPYWAPFSREINAALGELLGVRSAASTVEEFSAGTWDSFARRWDADLGAGSVDSLQALFFRNEENERFLLVAPASTWLLFLDAFLGVDVARLADDSRLWREFMESARVRPTMTELERAVFLTDAPRLGKLNPHWRARFRGSDNDIPDWKTRYFEDRAERGAVYLNVDYLYWERRAIQLGDKTVLWAMLAPACDVAGVSESNDGSLQPNDNRPAADESASVLTRRAVLSETSGEEHQNRSRLDGASERRPGRGSRLERGEDDSRRRQHDVSPASGGSVADSSSRNAVKGNAGDAVSAIPLPNLDEPLDNDEEKTLVIRVASGAVSMEDWLSLRPGDVLKTDAPADKLFDAMVDERVLFHVRPGVYRGTTAFQIKERVGDFDDHETSASGK